MNIQNKNERTKDLQSLCNMAHIEKIIEDRKKQMAQEKINLTDLTDSLSELTNCEKFVRRLNWIEVKTNLELYYLETGNEETKIILSHFDEYYKNL
jgi:hypothetical protein